MQEPKSLLLKFICRAHELPCGSIRQVLRSRRGHTAYPRQRNDIFCKFLVPSQRHLSLRKIYRLKMLVILPVTFDDSKLRLSERNLQKIVVCELYESPLLGLMSNDHENA